MMKNSRLVSTFGFPLSFVSLLLVAIPAGATFAWMAKTAPPTPMALSDLPLLNIDRTHITTSGVSSGAFMALQLHIAHSDLFSGAASVGGGPRGCAGKMGIRSFLCMSQPSKIDAQGLVDGAVDDAKNARIDSLSNLVDDKVFVFGSDADKVVVKGTADKIQEFYSLLDPKITVRVDKHATAAHGFLTNGYGAKCDVQGSPWLIDCGVDLASTILEYLGHFSSPRPLDQTTVVEKSSGYIYFDQLAFNPSLNDWGAAYIPEACRNGASCGLHVALHGCQMSPSSIGTQFIEHAGYNRWAEWAGVVILYPQTIATAMNPNECWDWFGYSSRDYTTQSAPQIKAIRAMIKTLSGY